MSTLCVPQVGCLRMANRCPCRRRRLLLLRAEAQEMELHFNELKEQVQDKNKVARAILRGFCGIHTGAGGFCLNPLKAWRQLSSG